MMGTSLWFFIIHDSLRLYDAGPEEIVHIQCANHAVIGISHQGAIDFVILHQFQHFSCKIMCINGFAIGCHYLVNSRLLQVNFFVQCPAQVAVSVYAQHPASAIDNTGHAQALAAHFQQGLGDAHIRRDARHVLASMHDVGHMQQQTATEAATRV